MFPDGTFAVARNYFLSDESKVHGAREKVYCESSRTQSLPLYTQTRVGGEFHPSESINLENYTNDALLRCDKFFFGPRARRRLEVGALMNKGDLERLLSVRRGRIKNV